jgi:hypothetical protein
VRNVRGAQLTGVYLSEAKELLKGVVDALDGRHGRYPKAAVEPTWNGMFGDTNAPDTDHWLYKLAEENRDANPLWQFFKQPGGLIRSATPDEHGRPLWLPNPLAENLRNLTGGVEYYTNMAQGKSADWIAVNLANEYGFVSDGKAVYPEYVDSLHCKAFELDPQQPILVGLDFGLTPAAAIGQRTATGRWRTRHELVTDHMSITTFGKDLARFLREHYGNAETFVYGDPSGNQSQPGDEETRTVFQLLEAVGIFAKPAPGNNDWTLRRESVGTLLRQLTDGVPAFLVHPDCKVLRKAMQGAYCLQRMQVSGAERYRDFPVKNAYSHIAEADQYMKLGGGEGRAVVGKPRRDANNRSAGPCMALGLDTDLG